MKETTQSAKSYKQPLSVAKIRAAQNRHNASVRKKNRKLWAVGTVVTDAPLWRQ